LQDLSKLGELGLRHTIWDSREGFSIGFKSDGHVFYTKDWICGLGEHMGIFVEERKVLLGEVSRDVWRQHLSQLVNCRRLGGRGSGNIVYSGIGGLGWGIWLEQVEQQWEIGVFKNLDSLSVANESKKLGGGGVGDATRHMITRNDPLGSWRVCMKDELTGADGVV